MSLSAHRVTSVTSGTPAGGRPGAARPAGMRRAPGPPGLPDPGRCLVMGVVNVTPDSFSDGGEWFGAEAAIGRGRQLAAQGADIVDVGGESTRPGAQRIPADEELRRVIPVITGLASENVPVSVDTMRAEVAAAALDAGASLVNDVSGGLADPDMPRLVARQGCPTWSCTGAGTATRWSSAPSTPTLSGRSARNCAAGSTR